MDIWNLPMRFLLSGTTVMAAPAKVKAPTNPTTSKVKVSLSFVWFTSK